MCAPRRFQVAFMQVELSDAGTPLVPANDLDKGTTRVWDFHGQGEGGQLEYAFWVQFRGSACELV